MSSRRIRLRRRKQASPDASKSSLEASTGPKMAGVVQRLILAETARVVPSDDEIEAAGEITEDDVTSAVAFWDKAQQDAGTGLDGLLDARVVTD